MSESSTGTYDCLIIGREIIGQGSQRYVSFRISLPSSHYHREHNRLIDHFNTRYSYVEALRQNLLEYLALDGMTALDLPVLDAKRLVGGMSASVINQRTRIINVFLRACQDNSAIAESELWDMFLRGEKPGFVNPTATDATPSMPTTPQERDLDRAPPPSLQENPAGVRGMGGFFANLFADANANAPPTPTTTQQTGESAPLSAPSAPPAFVDESIIHSTITRMSLSSQNNDDDGDGDNDGDGDDDDDDYDEQSLRRANNLTSAVAIATPRQVMQDEFMQLIQQHNSPSSNLEVGSPEELEAPEAWTTIISNASAPLLFELIGSFLLGLVVCFVRSQATISTTTSFCVVLMTVTSLVYCLGHVSGGHCNPVVTFAVFLRRHLTLVQTFWYWLSQFVGFLGGGVVAHEIFNEISIPIEIREGVDDAESVSNMSAFVLISVFSFFLCLTVLCTSTSVAQTGNSHFGLATGAVFAVGFVCLTNTGSSLNVSLDVALTTVKWIYTSDFPLNFGREYKFAADKQWGLLAGPFAGSFAAAFIYRYIKVTSFSKRSGGGYWNKCLKVTAPFWVELLGTGLIAFSFCMLADDVALLPFGYMSSVTAMTYTGGFISGGHYNPGVSLAVFLQGKINFGQLMMYIVFQTGGGFGAGSAYNWLYDTNPVPAVSGGGALSEDMASLVEFIFSFFVVFTYLNVAVAPDTRGNSFYGMAVGFASFVSLALASPITGGGLCNSAVGLGLYGSRWLWSCDGCSGTFTQPGYWRGLDECWVSTVVPLAGSVAAGVLFRVCVEGWRSTFLGGKLSKLCGLLFCGGRGGRGHRREEENDENYENDNEDDEIEMRIGETESERGSEIENVRPPQSAL